MTPWIQDWAAALESGYFKQTRNSLNQWDHEGRYSALGVLCEITGCKKQDRTALLESEMTREREFWKSTVPHYDPYMEQRYMNTVVDLHTFRYYTLKDKKRGNECLFYIPIDLTSKLNCNASLDLLASVRTKLTLRIEGKLSNPCVEVLDRHSVPFPVIAEFICDVWPALTFKTSDNFEVFEKDYGYFDLRRI